jgi:peptidoglycan/xylan/chitin deacetylase (PgdA/CDA1 family)
MIIFLSLIFALPLVLGLCALYLAGRPPKGFPCPALVFHEVGQKGSLLSLSEYPADRFLKFSNELKARNYKTVCLKDIPMDPEKKDKTLLITFDDAFESVYTCAAPALKQNSQTATIFAVAGFLGRRATWDVYSGRKHCTGEQLRELAAQGFEIGSHSLTHPNLCWLSDADLWSEVSDSKKILEDTIAQPVTSFSFPFGYFSKRVWEAVLKAGYTAAALYRSHSVSVDKRLVPVFGVYKFNSVSAIISKIDYTPVFSVSRAQSRIMAHFSKGSAVIKTGK